MAMTIDEQIDYFDESLRQLKVKYELFFAGALKMPPNVERSRLDNLVHEMSKTHIRDNARRFRFSTMVGRYQQYRELWGRRLRTREEGPLEFRRRAELFSEEAIQAAKQAARAAPVTRERPESYVRVTREPAGETIEALYAQIVEAQSRLGKPANVTLEQVSAMVRKQADALRERFGIDAIVFRVETVEGKVKLKARPETTE
ncbi:MAG TPA: MXAN_5187 C-terminal domain-containing protein [Thermoanaerobaculia bacterium]|nr:MXAN_5187 C-terminal domain-containing protein [Thermoanaerobaculia bacterium]